MSTRPPVVPRARPPVTRSPWHAGYVPLHPRRRARHEPGYYAMHRRRIRLDIQCRRAGMQMLRPGVWCDNVADVMYAGYGACDWGQW